MLHPPEEGGRLFYRRTKQVRVWPPSTARTTCMYVCKHAAISASFFCRTKQAAILHYHIGALIQEAACEGHIATCSRPQLRTDRARSAISSFTRQKTGYHWRQHNDMLPPPEEGGPPPLQGGEAGADIASTADFGTSLACMYA